MPMKEQQRQSYKTAINGKSVDMHKLRMQNEMTLAVGNMRVNARGDEIGPNGQIVRRREDIVSATTTLPDQKSVRIEPVTETAPPATKSSKKTSEDTSEN